jgi:hypothetical protein
MLFYFFECCFFEKKIGKYIERGTQFNLRVFLFEENFFFFFYEKTARGKFVRNCCNFFAKDRFKKTFSCCNTTDQYQSTKTLFYRKDLLFATSWINRQSNFFVNLSNSCALLYLLGLAW